ncbi:hypothetical protein MBLNU457_g1010t2 [Dothideomycetes sp. NU457]
MALTTGASMPVAQAGFSQQGSLDWMNLANTTVNFSVGVLSRCSAAGVDPYTIVVGQAVARAIPLSRDGHRNVENALSQLKSYGSFGDTLWFGFGIKSFPRALGTTDEGRTLLAISAALSECFHEDFAAETLYNLVLTFKPPSELTPSMSEWLHFVRACSGMLSLTKFPLLAEGYMRLDPSTKTVSRWIHPYVKREIDLAERRNTKISPPKPTGRGRPSPEDLAQTIKAVGKLANGQLTSMTIKCGVSIGWIAAVSEWLFGLTVTLRDCRGKTLHSNSPDPDEAQLQLWLQSGDVCQTTTLQTVSSTYHLRNGADLIAIDHRDALMTGRLDWSHCLDATFGSEFRRLLDIPIVLGTALGCAANVFKDIADGVWKKGPWQDGRWKGRGTEAYQSYFDAASGQGYITNAIRWFPELSSIKRHMEEAVRTSRSNAMTRYEVELAKIRKKCGCMKCRKGSDITSYSTKEREEHRKFLESETLCLATLLETIIILCHTMAGLSVADGLRPTRSGLESFYNLQTRRIWNRRGDDLSDYVSEWFYQGPDLTGTLSNMRLVDALRLFTGHKILNKAASATALAESGICAYFDILRDFSLGKELSGLIHVMPGSIERFGKPFRAVTDHVSLQDQAALDVDLELYTGPSLIVTETMDALQVRYQLANESNHSAELTNRTLVTFKEEMKTSPDDDVKASAGVDMQTAAESDADASADDDDDVNPSEHGAVKERTIVLIRRRGQNRDDYFRAMTLLSAKAGEHESAYACFLMDEQCLDCCMRAAQEYAKVHRSRVPLIILSEHAHYIDMDSGQRVPLVQS